MFLDFEEMARRTEHSILLELLKWCEGTENGDRRRSCLALHEGMREK